VREKVEKQKCEEEKSKAGPKGWPKTPSFPYGKTGKDGAPKTANLRKRRCHPPLAPSVDQRHNRPEIIYTR
jgi:hypothetical protein